MAFGLTSLEKRLKDNIKNYGVDQLLDIAALSDYLGALSRSTGISFLLVDRHGEKEVSVGNFVGFRPDVAREPGRKIRVENRTIAHLYVKDDQIRDAGAARLVECIAQALSARALSNYTAIETSIYADELEKMLEKEQYRIKHGEHEDALTGVMNNTYFDSHIKTLDENETVPVGVICVNINDWKKVDDVWGHEESDRLIKTVAQILKQESQEGYLIARCGGDLFNVLVPYAREGETEDYVRRIRQACDSFEDEHIAPSIACGMTLKTNVEQSIAELLSDAEYEMFDNKFSIKNSEEYMARLKKCSLA